MNDEQIELLEQEPPKEEKKAGDLDMCTGCGSHLAESGGKCQPCLDYQEHQSIR